MQLSLQSQFRGDDVVVIRCSGRIIASDETRALQLEVEKHTLETKKFVLQLEDVTFLDSGGLGALVRLVGTLRAGRGDLKLCQLSPFLKKVFETTKLAGVFHIYASEKEAIDSFAQRQTHPQASPHPSTPKVLCVESSGDLLAYLSALLKRSGYDVMTTKNLGDASTFVKAVKPALIICGPSAQTNASAFEQFRLRNPNVELLLLPLDFHATEASEAGVKLVHRIQALLSPQP
ncbi:MAG: anti-sigma factor antagonist [Candidatus Acidiferrales bacterium]